MHFLRYRLPSRFLPGVVPSCRSACLVRMLPPPHPRFRLCATDAFSMACAAWRSGYRSMSPKPWRDHWTWQRSGGGDTLLARAAAVPALHEGRGRKLGSPGSDSGLKICPPRATAIMLFKMPW